MVEFLYADEILFLYMFLFLLAPFLWKGKTHPFWKKYIEKKHCFEKIHWKYTPSEKIQSILKRNLMNLKKMTIQ